LSLFLILILFSQTALAQGGKRDWDATLKIKPGSKLTIKTKTGQTSAQWSARSSAAEAKSSTRLRNSVRMPPLMGGPNSVGFSESQYIRDHWEAEKGFPGGPVYAITQTADGYLRIGTEKGLVRFDGLNFRLIGATIFFAWVALATTFGGVMLWPVVILHAVITIALAPSLRHEVF
jgi:hypothetical protein